MGDVVELVGSTDKPFKTTIAALIIEGREVPMVSRGTTVGILLKGLERGAGRRGMVIASPGLCLRVIGWKSF